MFKGRELPPVEVGGVVGAADRRAQALRLLEERVKERAQRLSQQTSPNNTPQERIRIWEQLHELRLPRGANHSLLRVIAGQTALTLQQVHEEQERRGLITSTPGAVPFR